MERPKMRTLARFVLSRVTLKKYTGCFSDRDNSIRLVITQKGDSSLRLGGLDIIRGNIVESWMLLFSGVPAFTVGGSVLNPGLKAIARVHRGGYMVKFGI
jgi:hypothetical protein